jgi:hypothetical protein
MRTALHERYSTALREYCAKGTEAALSWDFQPSVLGRRAVKEGLGVLEMAAMHQKALVETLLEMLAVDDTTRITHRASEFVAEALAPFDQTHCPDQEGHPPLREDKREREELEATQKKLKGAMDLLLEQMRAEQHKNEIICVMNHEIHGALSVLMSGLVGDVNSHGQRLLDIALRNSERVMRLLDDSPEMESIESGGVTIDASRAAAGSGSASS